MAIVSALLFYVVLPLIWATILFLTARAGYRARRFGQGIGIYILLFVFLPLFRIPLEGVWHGWDVIAERWPVIVLSSIMGAILLTAVYSGGYVFGRRRRTGTGILPMRE